jgi:hypothetical protein
MNVNSVSRVTATTQWSTTNSKIRMFEASLTASPGNIAPADIQSDKLRGPAFGTRSKYSRADPFCNFSVSEHT